MKGAKEKESPKKKGEKMKKINDYKNFKKYIITSLELLSKSIGQADDTVDVNAIVDFATVFVSRIIPNVTITRNDMAKAKIYAVNYIKALVRGEYKKEAIRALTNIVIDTIESFEYKEKYTKKQQYHKALTTFLQLVFSLNWLNNKIKGTPYTTTITSIF